MKTKTADQLDLHIGKILRIVEIKPPMFETNPVATTRLRAALSSAVNELAPPRSAPVPSAKDARQPLSMGACIVDRMMHATVMSREKNGHITVVAQASIPVKKMLNHDILAEMVPVHSTQASRDVLAERQRQISVEGWTHEHDDAHGAGILGLAAALYALPYGEGLLTQEHVLPLDMALELACDWTLKPEPDARKRLVKAGALVLAEIERLDRAELAKAQEGGAA